jgi:hypothetical protein
VRRYGDSNESWSEFAGRVREYHERNRDSPLHADVDAAVECLLKHDRRLKAEDRAALESLRVARTPGETAGGGDQPERP